MNNIFIFISAVSGCVSMSLFASIVIIPGGLTISEVGLKIFAIFTGIKKIKSIINKEQKTWYNSFVSKR